ncbi:hypothetical protein MOV61_27105 [Neorhizobium sp. BETTINA12A]|uniref:hypothetical protein n=1 Tax=Neorhizobium TaxID=1525371 RepID=UPI00056F3773|nr:MULTISPECIES: hypothetical protein [Neorhizobium]MCJ9674111.1 hypothetical protein [Neorhizobium sp. SHOUNA12B]MCJ9748178.1 hypothetical protein [Neorhizobium sp. SHOUNA12A]MCJ9754404.1 hypothetical protein [Neorhizobium sp. BETTINA12A]
MDNESKENHPGTLSLFELSNFPSKEQMEKLVSALEAGDVDAALTTLFETREKTSHRSVSAKRKPGRLKGKLVVGPEFFEPLSEAEIRELTGE